MLQTVRKVIIKQTKKFSITQFPGKLKYRYQIISVYLIFRLGLRRYLSNNMPDIEQDRHSFS